MRLQAVSLRYHLSKQSDNSKFNVRDKVNIADMQDCARLAEVTQRCSYKLSDCVLT